MRIFTLAIIFSALLAGCSTGERQEVDETHHQIASRLPLGAFSTSLAVKDIETSRAFYEKLGFESVMGEPAQNWLIMRNGTTTIGLFQGLFENNIMTFNPGWTSLQGELNHFMDVRALQQELKRQGIVPVTEADESTTGPASFVIVDPDGNTIFFDQHVDGPSDSES